MARETLKQVLMKRDGLTSEEADDLIFDAKELLAECLAMGDFDCAENICEYEFGLEPDYIIDLM